MANNFHDVAGLLLVGIDLHDALLLPGVPLAPFVPIPRPKMPHINFLHPFSMGGNQKSTVLFNGRKTVVHWHQPEYLWPHLNLLPFPIDILIPIHIAFGSQTAWLPRGTVFIEGEPATCTNIAGPMSVDLDCWDAGNIPSSLVVQPSTVQTSPTLADYAAGVTAVAIDFAINALFNAVTNGVGGRRGPNPAAAADGAVARAIDPPPGAVPDGARNDVVDAAFPEESIDDAWPPPVPGTAVHDINQARAANWRYPDGRIWWPPHDGFKTPVPEPNRVLNPGETFDRYGGELGPDGKFTDPKGIYGSPVDTPYTERSLFPGTDTSRPHSVYQVEKPIPVRSGEVDAWFDEDGGGTQHVFPMTIDELIDGGYITEVSRTYP